MTTVIHAAQVEVIGSMVGDLKNWTDETGIEVKDLLALPSEEFEPMATQVVQLAQGSIERTIKRFKDEGLYFFSRDVEGQLVLWLP